MSHVLPTKRTLIFRAAALALSASALLAASNAHVAAQPGKSTPLTDRQREYRATYAYRSSERCVAANGAQIMGGFAGPGDRLDAVTGQICPR